ncbi:MAG: fimbrial assembly protein, partial [Desulfitobacterium sp.]|nr:fimbrial assembly protein [Desulfitobacterium sp.]
MREKTQLNFAQRWQTKLDAPRKAKAKKRRRIIGWVFLGVFIIILGSFPWLYKYKLGMDIAVVNQEIENLQELDFRVYERDTLQAKVNTLEETLEIIEENRMDPSEVLNRLQEYLPAGAVVNSFDMQKDKTLNASITFLSPLDVTFFWSMMNDSEYF